MKSLTIGMLCAFSTLILNAQTEQTDTVKARELSEIVVEARRENLGVEVSTYIPTSKQKNAAQTANDLLNRMAIPQLNVSPTGEVTDLAGKSVDLFIDFLPAAKEDLEGMRMQDVRKVEYYDYPSDPRFQGKAHVVNFVMQKYEYGGYVKALGSESSNDVGRVCMFSKLQYKRMTFDIAAGAFYSNRKHNGSDTYETFRLPQPDGSVREFKRFSVMENGISKDRVYWPTFKALYSTDKITIKNIIGGEFSQTPVKSQSGHIFYQPEISPRTDFSEVSGLRENSFSYSGYWNFILNDKNTINFNPSYAYTHTNSNSSYTEPAKGEFFNAAKDNSHKFSGLLTYSYSFGAWGKLNTMLKSSVSYTKTCYTGTANTNDNTHIYSVGPGAEYSVTKGKVYGLVGIGFDWNKQEYLDHKETYTEPWVDFSLQYTPNNRHSVSGDFHYSTWTPLTGSLSSAVIQSNPLMSYTGNPNLVPFRSYDAGVQYTFIPNNRMSFSAFASSWIVANRYVYDYLPTANGILRTIRQPGGGYSNWTYVLFGKINLFDRKLQLSTHLVARTIHNGEPNNIDKTFINYAFQANFYLDNWSFSGIYYGPNGYSDGCMTGNLIKMKSTSMISVGWSSSAWKLQVYFYNFERWNWKSTKTEMYSPYYDKIVQNFSNNDHASVRLTVTYTFGFGKKVEHGDEASQQSGTSSGILK